MLKKFNANIINYPNGLTNFTGYHCYWNSCVQSLLTCTSLIEMLHSHSVFNMEDFILELHGNKYDRADKLFKFVIGKMLHVYKDRDIVINFVNGQQCAYEALLHILSIIELSKPLHYLFKHRYSQKISCLQCNAYSLSKQSSVIFQLDNDANIADIIEKKINIDFSCDKCNHTKAIKHIRLTYIPEILIVVSKRFTWNDEQKASILPNKIKFPEILNVKNKYNYKAIAYINHYGTLNGGHYTSTCLRRNPSGSISWYLCNDSSVSPAQFLPDESTYIMFYHVDH